MHRLEMEDVSKRIRQGQFSADERHALTFLYAYMEYADMANFPVDFFLEQVRSTLSARQEMPWSSQIPQELFMHYVLPLRVNNEELDRSRTLFFAALRDRVKGLSMQQAALEVNHWCREHVSYAAGDPRTLSPVAVQRNALGRCGELSTFAVAAMRSVGIPARQVYTHRWAHTDDNHAWVEIWIDGQWYFLGGGEPAPKLNMAWFNTSVSRAMLVQTKAFGALAHDTREEVVNRTKTFTEVNSISYYAPTRKISVRVQNVDGRPVEHAQVQYCLYNYAEFFTMATKMSDAQGYCHPISVGKGDMMIKAYKNGLSGYAVAAQRDDETVTVTLLPFDKHPAKMPFTMRPPVEGGSFPEVSAQEAQEYNAKLAKDDAIRQAYERTFYSLPQATEAVKRYAGLDAEHQKQLAQFLYTSRGNHQSLTQFIEQQLHTDRNRAVDFLSVLSEKDLTDISLATLSTLFDEAVVPRSPFELRYVTSPRVEDEFIVPFVTTLRAAFSPTEIQKFQSNPADIVVWMSRNLKDVTDENPQRIVIKPTAVIHTKRTDLRSAQLFFVALCRAIGVPARRNPVTREVEYTLGETNEWTEVDLQAQAATNPILGSVQLDCPQFKPGEGPANPGYYSHFTMARQDTNGQFNTLEYEHVMDCTWKTSFSRPMSFEAGRYSLITGTRLADGSVNGFLQHFVLRPHSRTTLTLAFPYDREDVAVIGSIDAEDTYLPLTADQLPPALPDPSTLAPTSLLSTTGRGYFVLCFLESAAEPTNHALKDLEKVQEQLNQWGRPFLFLFPSEKDAQDYKTDHFTQLPEKSYFGFDRQQVLENTIREATQTTNNPQYPLVVVADSFGRVVFVKQGYTIGLGEQILKILPKL